MTLESANIHGFISINSLAGQNPYLDALMIFFARYVIYLIPLFLLYLWFRKKEDKQLALFVLLTVLLGLGISAVIGIIYYHPRPFVLGLGTQLISHAPDNSFPSEHTVAMFSFALPFLFFKKYRSGTIFTILAAIVGFSRVFCGVHFPLDILGGALIALIVVLTLYMARNPIMNVIGQIIERYEQSRIFKMLHKQ